MRKVMLLLAVGLMTGADKPGDADREDRQKLQGTWEISVLENNGKVYPGEGSRVVFKGGEMIIEVKAGERKASFKVDATKKPRQIDITPKAGPDKGQTLKGIYLLDGDNLKICHAARSSLVRPTKFSALEGSGNVLLLLKRAPKKGKDS